MLNTVYQLKRPIQFAMAVQDVHCDDEHILVRPTYLSICNADQRYYQGTRAEEVLKEKLPLALIHEGIGRVVYDPTGTFAVGDDVVMIPNLPSETDEYTAENYLRSSKFRGSSADGFMQEYILTVPDRLVSLPDHLNREVAAFTEIVSVSFHAISRFDKIAHARRRRIGVWGDGNLGYITSLLLKKRFPDSEIYVFGVNQTKLNDFTFADKVFLTTQNLEGISIDHAFECVGGGAASKAINQIIDLIAPEGTISILGVSEDLSPINTRMVLEKGLRIFGSSRSGRKDFTELIEFYKKYPNVPEYLENIVGSTIHVRNIQDMTAAFEADINKLIGKTIMIWDK